MPKQTYSEEGVTLVDALILLQCAKTFFYSSVLIIAYMNMNIYVSWPIYRASLLNT